MVGLVGERKNSEEKRRERERARPGATSGVLLCKFKWVNFADLGSDFSPKVYFFYKNNKFIFLN